MKKLLAIISATGIAATGVVVAAPAAQAKTVKACVKKSDGTVRLINKKNPVDQQEEQEVQEGLGEVELEL